jgi:hypothetical protein
MRAQEFLIESQLAPFADGKIKISQHAFDRSRQRRVPVEKIIQAINKLAVTRQDDLKKLPPTAFVVNAGDFQMAISKSQNIESNKILYTVHTVGPRLKIAAGQRVVYLEEGTDFTNAVNSVEKLVKQNNIEFETYEDLLRFVASRKFLQTQRNDQKFIDDVARSVLRRLHSAQLNEINDDDELSVSQRIQDYFVNRGYKYLGEGRDQIAFLSPRNTVLKVLGIGEDEREDIVKTYVGFFLRNQRNPHYPRIYNAGDFAVDGETYFVYEMEYLYPVSGEDRVLEYIEDLMSALPRGEQALEAFYKNKKRPPELSEQQVDGLVFATQDLEDAIGGQAPLDLRSIENLGRRKDGQIVIIDPFSL